MEIRRFTLDNGLTVVIEPSHKARTVSAYLAVKSGSADESDWMGSGLSHYVEHMLFKGTPKRPGAGSVEDEVRRMGGSTNAYTSYDLTVYYLNALSKDLDGVLDLLSDVAFNANFPAEELEKERQVILGEFRMNEDRLSRVAEVALWHLSFQTHSYGHPVIGYRKLFESVSRDDLIAFYKQNYIPNNMVLSVVGDFDADTAESIVRSRFGAAERGILRKKARPSEPRQLTPRLETIYKESQHARLMLGFPGVPITDADAVALDVLSGILGEGDGSRLNQRVKEKAGLALEVESFNSTLRDSGIFGIRSLVLADKLGEAREAMLETLRDLKTRPVDAADLERVKNQVLARYYSGMETHDSLAHDLLTSEVYAGDYRFSLIYADRVKKITAEDIRRVATAYFDEDRLNEVRLLPADSKKAQQQAASAGVAQQTVTAT